MDFIGNDCNNLRGRRVYLSEQAEPEFGGIRMKLKNVLIVVKDIEKSRQFYHDLFGLDVVLDNDGNLIEVGTPMRR